MGLFRKARKENIKNEESLQGSIKPVLTSLESLWVSIEPKTDMWPDDCMFDGAAGDDAYYRHILDNDTGRLENSLRFFGFCGSDKNTAMLLQIEKNILAKLENSEDRVRLETDLARTKESLAKAGKIHIHEAEKEEIFQNLRITQIVYSIDGIGAVSVTTDFEVKFQEGYTGKKAIDGCVAARIYEKDEYVGAAYYVFPLGGITRKTRLKAYCNKPINLSGNAPDRDYTIEYEPVYLWETVHRKV